MSRVLQACWITVLVLVGAPSWALDWSGYQVSIVRPGGDRPCTLFQLVGVAQADPAVSTSPWFAIPNTAPEYSVMVATLLVAKASGSLVTVTTTGSGQASCLGHPGVAVLLLN